MAYNKFYKKKSSPVKSEPVRLVRNWSTYQREIFAAIASGTHNIIVEAVPGSGKTTTIVEGVYHIPATKSVCFLAFNTKIVKELQERLPKGVEARTLHSIGMRVITNAFGKVVVDNDKSMRAIIGLMGDDKEKSDEREIVRKTVSLCKGHLANTTEEIAAVMDLHGITGAEKKQASMDEDGNSDQTSMNRNKFIEMVQKVLELAKMQQNLIDFDDMTWLPNVFKLQMPQFDYVLVDELQDLNAAQFGMLFSDIGMCRKNSVFVGVGDRFQAIYGFRSAMSDAMDKAQQYTNAIILPLSVSYRCAKNIVEVAKSINPSIEASPDAVDGVVENCTIESMMNSATNGDFILSRTNAPLVGACLSFIKMGKKANVAGRDMGRSLAWMITRSKTSTVAEFMNWLEDWKNTEVERLTSRNKDASFIIDKADCLIAFCEGCVNLNSVKEKIAYCFSDESDEGRITLSTVHKAKGLERKRAYVLAKTFKAGRNQEESNLLYVAVSRPKETLMMVS